MSMIRFLYYEVPLMVISITKKESVSLEASLIL